MKLSTLQTLSFTLLFIISTCPGESHPDPVLDWAGNPVEAGVPYELWIVGFRTGPIGAGSFTDQGLGLQYVIDKQWSCYRAFDGTPVLIYPDSNPEPDSVVPAATDSTVKFADRFWTIGPDYGNVVKSFVITSTSKDPPGDIKFQFIRVNGTTENPHLYKLSAVRGGVLTDVILISNPAGEKSLYLNNGNSIPDEWGTKLSFVKSIQTKNMASE